MDLANSTEGDQSDDDYDYVHNSSTVGDNGENELESMGLEDNKNKEEGEDSHGDGDSSSYDTTEVGEREVEYSITGVVEAGSAHEGKDSNRLLTGVGEEDSNEQTWASYNYLKMVGYLNNLKFYLRQEHQGAGKLCTCDPLLKQYGFKGGPKIFCKWGFPAAVKKKELQKFHNRQVAKSVSEAGMTKK